MKYILGVFATVFVLIALIFWLVVGNSDRSTQPAQEEKAVVLTDYADSAARVSYEIRGELVGDESRQAVRITVDRNQRTVEILDGYRQKVVNKKTFGNNAAAFEEFVYALSRAGFVAEQEPQLSSEKGVCPEGNVMIYSVKEGDKDVSWLWAGSCDDEAGTFGGDDKDVEDLFEAQIPDYRDLTRDVSL